MRVLMTSAFAAALTVVSGVAMAQSYGPGDPACADTSDPQSAPMPRTHYGAAPRGIGSYGYSQPYQGSSGYQPRRGRYGR
jgi:hypothetical protein